MSCSVGRFGEYLKQELELKKDSKYLIFNYQLFVSIRSICTDCMWAYPEIPELTKTENGKWCNFIPLRAIVSLCSKSG